jgi:copper chaperone NosL
MNQRLVMLTLFLIVLLALTSVCGAGVDAAVRCKQCGMSRSAYDYSRMLVSYRSGAESAVCSLHCAAADLSGAKEKKGAALQVADYDTRKLISAERAVWTVGGARKGVMTAQPKWAFGSRAAAERFVRQNGGSIVSFREVMKAAAKEVQDEAAAMRQYHEMQGHQGH